MLAETCFFVIQLLAATGTEHKMNTHGSWRYIDVLWNETIGLCKKGNII